MVMSNGISCQLTDGWGDVDIKYYNLEEIVPKASSYPYPCKETIYEQLIKYNVPEDMAEEASNRLVQTKSLQLIKKLFKEGEVYTIRSYRFDGIATLLFFNAPIAIVDTQSITNVYSFTDLIPYVDKSIFRSAQDWFSKSVLFKPNKPIHVLCRLKIIRPIHEVLDILGLPVEILER